jgi:steroid Delta-isomerase
MADAAAIRQTVEAYFAAFKALDVEAVVQLFAEDCSVEDPAGAEPVRGREAVRAFYAQAMARNPSLRLQPPIRVAGDEAAFAFSGEIDRKQGRLSFDVIDHMRFDAAGRITAMRAIFGPDNMRLDAMAQPAAADAPLDRVPFRDLAERYARAMDRRDLALLLACFTPDGVIDSGEAGRFQGQEGLGAIVAMLGQMFVKTMHFVHNQTVERTPGGAEGETYCIASHIIPGEAGWTKLDWAIRYQDRYVQDADGWRFAQRRLIVEWAHTVPVDAFALPNATSEQRP